MPGPRSRHPRFSTTTTLLSVQLAAVTAFSIATSTDVHADANLAAARAVAADTTPLDAHSAGVGIALHVGGELARTPATLAASHVWRSPHRLDHRRGDDCDRPSRGRGRGRGSRSEDEFSGIAVMGAGLAVCAFGLLVPLGEPESHQSPDWDGDGWPDDRWNDDQSDDWRDGSYNAANVLLVALGGGLMAWGVHIETQSRHRSFALAPSFKPDGTARGIETGLVASVRF